MENPFPGMNPYLEDSRLWADVHHAFIAALRTELNTLLPPNYVASVAERVYVEKPETLRLLIPDVVIARPVAPAVAPAAATALADAPIQIEMRTDAIREPFVQILALRDGQRKVVAVIELLRLTNKTPNAVGRALYLQKQQDLLQRATHLIEIDLLHYGEHTVFVPRALLERGDKRLDYVVVLHKGGWGGQKAWAWCINLRERLPRITIPLAGSDPEVVVDLQAILNRVYQEGRYPLLLNYTANLPVERSPDDREWLDALLKERGLRPK